MQAKLIALGLEYKDNGNICCTKLGAQLSVDLWTAFLGHHDPAEIPAILNRYGFVTSDEELEIAYRFEDGESIEALVYPPRLRRVQEIQHRDIGVATSEVGRALARIKLARPRL